jgi:Asp-tRNA(Asn)/Glu-tRNA(Gln) amidotransferase A subunit family amidase
VREALRRIDADRHNAVVWRRDDSPALREAAIAVGPLGGIPFTVKDALEVAGMPSTSGSVLLRDHIAVADAPVVAVLRPAGAVVVGKTNCAEFALAPLPGNDLFGTTLNPRDASRTVGGSSCGCAAAVAAGLVTFSVGSDYGGSVRYPAECAGIVGFRPAAGSLDAGGQVPPPPPGSPRARFSVPGLLCRDVATLETLAGVLLPDESPSAARGRTATGTEAAPDVFAGAESIFAALRAADDAADLRALARGRESLLTEPMRALLGRAPRPPEPDVDPRLDALRARVDAVLDRTPVLILPVTSTPTPALRDCTGHPEHVDRLFRSLEPCRAVTLLGLHSISVPVEHGRNVQVVTRRGSLDLALRVASAMERKPDGLAV